MLEELKEKNEQLKKYYKFLRIKEIKDNEIVNNICFHWAKIWNFSYELNFNGKTTIKKFLSFLTPQEIKESMDIAFCKIPDRIEDCFKYFCGVVYTKKRNNN